MYIKTLSVSALNGYIKKTLDADFILNNLNIKGEISNFKLHSSGHMYFSLKDESSKINCVMFRSAASTLNFIPKDGEAVIVKGKISVYEKEGSYQLYCSGMAQAGLGELYLEFQEMKNRLEKKGLFDPQHKREIPKYPRKVGIITSPTGAAVRDIINVASRRNNKIELLIYPALVQGKGASEDIIRGIEALNKMPEVDIIILARGGGSIEELWAFNNESLAYAVYNSEKVIITGVGHETDFTIVDFVSDRRAPTPSAAAEIAVPSIIEITSRIDSLKNSFVNRVNRILSENYSRVDILRKTVEVHSPLNHIVNQYRYIDRLQDRLRYNIKSNIDSKKETLGRLNALLNAHNPLKVLNKGYSIIEDTQGIIINETASLRKLSKVKITLRDGQVKANINFYSEED